MDVHKYVPRDVLPNACHPHPSAVTERFESTELVGRGVNSIPFSVKNFLFDETIDPSRHRLLVANGELSDVRKNTFADRAWTPKTLIDRFQDTVLNFEFGCELRHAIRKRGWQPGKRLYSHLDSK